MSNTTTVTRKQFARHIALATGRTIAEIDMILSMEHGLIEAELKNDNRVKIGTFGVLAVRQAPAKKARNPRTGAEVMVPARRKITFKEFAPAKAALKD